MSRRVFNRNIAEEMKMFEEILNDNEEEDKNNISELKVKIDKRLEELNAKEDEKKTE